MAALAPVVDTLDKVPESARTFYVQKEGKYHLDLEGAPAGFVPATQLAEANTKVVEFRDKNVELMKEVEPLRTLKTQFTGIDPEAAKTALAAQAEFEKKGMKKPDDITAQIQAAVTAAVKPLQDQVAASNAAVAAERKRADEGTLRTVIGEKFGKVGGKAKAIDYIITQAQSVFTVEGGAVKPVANKYSTDRPGEPLGVDEWLGQMAKEHDFAFEPSKGGGAGGGGNSDGTGAPQLRAGQTLLTNPTPAQLGENSKAIAEGKVKVHYTEQK